VREKFYRDSHSLEGEIRDYVNTFGFLQKNVNGLDILIEVIHSSTSCFSIAQPIAHADELWIQDAKQLLRGWGGAEPNFLLINSRLTFQLQMSPERTQYATQVLQLTNSPSCGQSVEQASNANREQGADGKRRLEEGPNLQSYRGIRIIHSQQFPMQVLHCPILAQSVGSM
jgi:hypothetical protein